MNWIANLFRSKSPSAINGAVVFLDVDALTATDIERIKQKMTPLFVEYSSHRARTSNIDVTKSVSRSE